MSQPDVEYYGIMSSAISPRSIDFRRTSRSDRGLDLAQIKTATFWLRKPLNCVRVIAETDEYLATLPYVVGTLPKGGSRVHLKADTYSESLGSWAQGLQQRLEEAQLGTAEILQASGINDPRDPASIRSILEYWDNQLPIEFTSNYSHLLPGLDFNVGRMTNFPSHHGRSYDPDSGWLATDEIYIGSYGIRVYRLATDESTSEQPGEVLEFWPRLAYGSTNELHPRLHRSGTNPGIDIWRVHDDWGAQTALIPQIADPSSASTIQSKVTAAVETADIMWDVVRQIVESSGGELGMSRTDDAGFARCGPGPLTQREFAPQSPPRGFADPPAE